MKVLKIFPIVLILLSSILTPLLGQETGSGVSGTVKDESGAVIPAVSVSAVHVDTGRTHASVTDEQGRYRFSNLALGNYRIEAELQGFKRAVREGITLTVGRQAVVDLTLSLGEISERVVVTGEAPLVDVTTSEVSGLVDERKVHDLPLNGRSLSQLIALQPGTAVVTTVTASINQGRGLQLSIAGSRPKQNSFLLDGTDTNDMINSTPGSVAGVMLGVETLREFRVLTGSYSAEFGRTAGAVINAVTKSGTNEFHGSVFEFHRNSALDAKNFFDALNKPIPPFKRNQYGFMASGPIAKNKTFFLGSYEALRERLGLSHVATVPGENARNGFLPDPSRPGQLRNVGVHQAVRPYLEFFPRANGRQFVDGTAEYLSSPTRPTDEHFFVVKVDHNFSDSDSFFARYTFDDATFNTPDSLGFENYVEESRNQYVTLEEKRIFTESTLNLFRFGLNRSVSGADDLTIPNVSPSLWFIPDTRFGSVGVSGLRTLGPGTLTPRSQPFNLFEFSENLYHTRGSHSLKVGMNYKRIQANIVRSSSNFGGSYGFASLETFLRNIPRNFEFEEGSTTRYFRQSLFGFYLQDDIRMTPRLTLNLGLRYEFITVPIETRGAMSALIHLVDPAFTVTDEQFGRNPSLKNFAPRVGLAWDPFGTGKTSLRAGFGIFYDQHLPFVYKFPVTNNPPFVRQGQILTPPFPNPFGGTRSNQPPRAEPFVWLPGQPYRMHYSLNLQREIFPSTVVSLGYVGSKAVHSIRQVQANIAEPTIVNGRKFFAAGLPRRNPNFEALRFKFTDGNATYNGLLLSVARRLAGGFQFQSSYTWSKSIDDGSNTVGATDFNSWPGEPQDPDDRNSDRGLSPFSVEHTFVTNYTWDLPIGPRGRLLSSAGGVAGKLLEGWQLGGILTLSSGPPFSVGLGFDSARQRTRGGGGGGQRPNLKPGFSNNPVLGGPDLYVGPNAFELAPAGFYGNLGKNTVIGPGLATVDLSLVKNTSVSEGKQLQFRTEFFNLFNRPNFSIPARTIFRAASGIPAANFGRITSTTSTSRQIQFALKFIF
ncbi:MAG: TonB-dependent receptor [Acidobacteria bacterium]|nr:TonB-dependent receptor [Acidobacteriota bacterium]